LQLTASRLLDQKTQKTQKTAGQDELFDGFAVVERARAVNRRRAHAASRRGPPDGREQWDGTATDHRKAE
jgi:hypothetical protein